MEWYEILGIVVAWEVHVAYRWILQPDSMEDLLKNYRPNEIL